MRHVLAPLQSMRKRKSVMAFSGVIYAFGKVEFLIPAAEENFCRCSLTLSHCALSAGVLKHYLKKKKMSQSIEDVPLQFGFCSREMHI